MNYAQRHHPEVVARKLAMGLPGLNATTKEGWLCVLEHVPQHFWPPSPTRQTKVDLYRAICRAIAAGKYTFDSAHCQRAA